MNGILNINKPSGKTSYDIVAMVKRLTGERRVGHTGTLDPTATGVLPVCLGKGTRITQFLMEATKKYKARIELGVTTDTYDASGRIMQVRDASGINQKELETALISFRGLIQQTPPMYSAVRYHGKRLYELARAGVEVKRSSRLTRVFHLELTEWQPPLATIEIICSKGTYVRVLAHDLGQTLGCGANLKSLVRLKCGPFELENAISIPQFEDAVHYGYWQQFVYPVDIVLLHWVAMVVDDNTEQVIRNGRPVFLKGNSYNNEAGYPQQNPGRQPNIENRCRVYTSDGCFLGVMRFDPEKNQWQPEKIFL